MPKPSALSVFSPTVLCGTLILFGGAPQAPGQNPQPPKNQIENLSPLFHFTTGGLSDLRVVWRGSGMETNPNSWKGADLSAAPQLQVHFPLEQPKPATVPTMILPSMPDFAKFAQTAPAPALKNSGSYEVQRGQTAEVVVPPMPNALPLRVPPQQDLCSVPLLRIQPDRGSNFTIRQIPMPPMDAGMVVKPAVPSCDEATSSQRPRIIMPLHPNHR